MATQLLNAVIEIADGQGAKILLDGSPMGVLLYRRLEWREVDVWWPVNPEKYEGAREYKWTAMIREPRGVV